MIGTTIRQSLFEALYAAGRTKDAVECFHQMTSELGGETSLHGEHLEWALGEQFRMSWCRRLLYVTISVRLLSAFFHEVGTSR